MSRVMDVKSKARVEAITGAFPFDPCPACGEQTEQNYGAMEPDAGQVMQKVRCTGCGASWVDIYRYTRVVSLVVPPPRIKISLVAEVVAASAHEARKLLKLRIGNVSNTVNINEMTVDEFACAHSGGTLDGACLLCKVQVVGRFGSTPVPFGNLAIGDVFEFDHTGKVYHERDAHGPWVKTAAHCFKQRGDRNESCDHGSIEDGTLVHRGEDCGGDHGI